MNNQKHQQNHDGGQSELSGFVSQGLSIKKDLIAEKLDEMADICEYWKKNRGRGYTPNAIRSALLMLADEITLLRAHDKPRRLPASLRVPG